MINYTLFSQKEHFQFNIPPRLFQQEKSYKCYHRPKMMKIAYYLSMKGAVPRVNVYSQQIADSKRPDQTYELSDLGVRCSLIESVHYCITLILWNVNVRSI